VLCEHGELTAQVSGKYRHRAQWRSDYPAVGDWVAIDARPFEGQATIHQLLPRRTSFVRKAVLSGGMPDTGGKTDNQVLAANVDVVLLVSSLNEEFNLRRIERFLTISWDSGAMPVIVLNKADLCDDPEAARAETEAVAIGVPIHVVSAADDSQLDELRQYLAKGQTLTFLGSSGVGKSTIINRLLGFDRQEIGEVRLIDSKGRHTTTHRELILHPDGSILIDTPGMRQLGMWTDESGLSQTFDDVEALIAQCRFGNCTHTDEPGCAVLEAVASGELDQKRLDNYRRLRKELLFMERRKDKAGLRKASREWGRKIQQYHRAMKDLRKKGLA
jgi:ribosome biogenesis GTPase